MKKIPVSGLIYDLDGTLIDSRRDLSIATNVMLAHLGLPSKSEKELINYIGKGVKNLVLRALDGHESYFEEGLAVMTHYYHQHLTDHTTLYEGVIEALEYFKTKKQFVLTNKLDIESKMIIEQLGLTPYFTEVVGDIDSKSLKPDPAKLIEIINKYNLLPEKTIMVGDSAIDIETGYNARATTVFIREGLGKISNIQPDIIIGNIKELKEYFI